MGYWCTLHLFDDKIFYNDVVPKLQGKKGDLYEDYLGFLKFYTTGGIEHLSQEKIESRIVIHKGYNNNISNSFDKLFRTHSVYNEIMLNNPKELFKEIEGYEEFLWFFQYYVFKYCADFYPQILLGKGKLMRNFQMDKDCLAYSIISYIDTWNEFFCFDLFGITNWITAEDVKLLYLDKEKLKFEDSLAAEGFLTLLEVAYLNELGLIAGVDLPSRRLERLQQNKLTTPKAWDSFNIKGICFDVHKPINR